MGRLGRTLLIAACLAGCAERPRLEPPPATPAMPAPAPVTRQAPRIPALPAAVDCSPPWAPFDRLRWEAALEGEPERPEPESRPTPPPDRWGDGDRTLLEAMKAVCDVFYSEEGVGGRPLLGCTSCAIGPTGAAPRAFTPVAGWNDHSRLLVNLTTGSFTRSGADEALVTLAGCEPSPDRSGTVGYGNALVERRGGGYRRLAYEGRLGSCKETRRADRKAFVCVNWDRRDERSISVVDWNERPVRTEILRLASARPMDEICDRPDHAEVGDLGLVDFDGDDQDSDGIGDVRVHVKLVAWRPDVVAAARAEPDLAAACACEKATREWANRVKAGCRCRPVIDLNATTTRPVELSFLARRDGFAPTPATREALALLRRHQIVAAPSAGR